MTAEIAICNANGIALAADSAVSMRDGEKIYNSANKLFSLSKYHPIAIMVYNSGSLLNVPWETIIKQYREELGKNEFGTLKEYGESFWTYIHSQTSWFPQREVEGFVEAKIQRLVLEIRERFFQLGNDEEVDASDEDAVRSILSRVVDEFHEISLVLEFADNFDEQDIADIQAESTELFQTVLQRVLENSYDLLADTQKDRLIAICATCLTKTHFDHYSGVVIAGFGKEEILPKVASYKAGIFANKKLRIQFDQSLSNTGDEEFIPQIFPYAQDDVVRSFIQGVDPEIDKYLISIFSELEAIASEVPAEALAGENDAEVEASRELIRQEIAGYSEKLTESYTQTKYELGTSELLAMLNVLPKDELAEMAESLVNLTAFKRRMSAAKESVGGPVDVAILSKGDGFIWIKRKHYFKPEFNQNYFHNYFPE